MFLNHQPDLLECPLISELAEDMEPTKDVNASVLGIIDFKNAWLFPGSVIASNIQRKCCFTVLLVVVWS